MNTEEQQLRYFSDIMSGLYKYLGKEEKQEKKKHIFNKKAKSNINGDSKVINKII